MIIEIKEVPSSLSAAMPIAMQMKIGTIIFIPNWLIMASDLMTVLSLFIVCRSIPSQYLWLQQPMLMIVTSLTTVLYQFLTNKSMLFLFLMLIYTNAKVF